MIGQTVSHYRILRELGSGGMGVVYEATDTRLGRRVALKFLTDKLDSSADAHGRFEREARAVSTLNHPNICTLYDVGENEGSPFIVMELMKGQPLKHRLAGEPLEIDQVLELGSQVAHALEASHAAGIVHRDVKPANIFITDLGQAKLLDFGLAKVDAAAGSDEVSRPTAVDGEALTGLGAAVGTAAYMSPEQAQGEWVDARSDIFSLGAVLYEMATGCQPFPGKTVAQVFSALLNEGPVSPSRLNPEVPADLSRIILDSLEKDPDARCQSASEIRAELRRLKHDTSSWQTSATRSLRRALGAWRLRRAARRAALAMVMAGALALAAWFGRTVRSPATPEPPSPSIAVLPFVNLSDDADNEYFSDGLTEELLNVLAKVPGLRVAGRSSAFQFKGRSEDLRSVGRELNVTNILEGSVRKVGDRVRISAQLVTAVDGFQLWSDTYDRQLYDIFAVQEDIARSVVAALEVTLLGGETAEPLSPGGNAQAYNAYLQGRYFLGRGGAENLERALDHYQQAVALDPGYAPAWAGLARTYARQVGRGYGPIDEGWTRSRQAAERALATDPNLAEGHAALGWILRSYDWDWAGADAAFQRALALEPGNASVILDAAVMAFTRGRIDEAIALDLRAVELDPLSIRARYNLGLFLYWAGRLDAALTAFGEALERHPDFPGIHQYLCRVYLVWGRPEAALQEAEREPEIFWRQLAKTMAFHALGRQQESDLALAEIIANHQADSAFQIAEAYAFRGEVDRAFEWLERAYVQRDGGLAQMIGNPVLASLADDPRLVVFLERMKLNTD